MLSVIQVQVSSTIEARVDDQSSVWMKKIPPASIWPGQLALCFLPFFFLFFFFLVFFSFFFCFVFSFIHEKRILVEMRYNAHQLYVYIYIYILCIYILEIDSAAGILVAALPLSLFLFDRFVRLLLSYIRFITIFVWKRESRRTRERRTLLSVCFSLSIASFIHKTRLFIFFVI